MPSCPSATREALVSVTSHRRWEDGNLHKLSHDELRILKMTSLIVASLSIISAFVAFYWFIGMRRSFRHDLIMLVIQSDMFKALWFMIYPVVELIQGTLPSNSAFCQVSGFFLALAIEASDVAVVLVALHTSLYIFGHGNGLYPYRRIAYGAFIILPLVLSGLAFINKPAFVNSGDYCYLPEGRNWSGRALSWIPRYVIFITLLVSYACIYAYVVLHMSKFKAEGRGGRSTSSPVSGRQLPRRRTASVPPMPAISYHGLIPSSFSSQEEEQAPGAPTSGSSWTTVSHLTAPNPLSLRTPSRPRVQQYILDGNSGSLVSHFGLDSAIPPLRERSSLSEGHISPRLPSRTSTITLQPPIPLREWGPASERSSPPRKRSSRLSSTGLGYWNRSVGSFAVPTSRVSSRPNLAAMLRGGPQSSSSESSVFLSPTLLDETGVVRTRERVSRQLRLLFIYPLVYLIVWIVPFVSHIVGGDAAGASFGMVLVSLLSLCIQGTVDALVFSIKERPWKKSLRCANCRFHLFARRESQEGRTVGRSREEMTRDNRLARRRRERELADRQTERLEVRESATNWWEQREWGPEGTTDEEEE